MTLKRINREVADLKKEDLGSIVLQPTEGNLHVWKGTIPGPEGSVYEGGIFHVEIILPADYPFSAPRVTFKTRIYHMNISENGSICIDILKTNWSPALSLFKVMLSISSLLTDPNPKDPLVPTVATQYTQNRKQHDATAREWTRLYAKPKPSLVSTPAQVAQASSSASVTPSQQLLVPESSRGQASRRGAVITGGVRNVRASASAAGSQAATPVIIIDDENEASAGPSSSSRALNTKKKRKRETHNREVVDLVAEDTTDLATSGSAAKKQRTTRKGDDDQIDGDIIVIEDN